MADVQRAGLPFFDVFKSPKIKRRRVEDYLDSEEDEDFCEDEDLGHVDPVDELDSNSTVSTPLGQLSHSQADRVFKNVVGIRFINNQSRKGRVAAKSRRHLFDDTAFSNYVNPTKCCHAALTRGCWGLSRH
jgi:hypothetical protein